VARPKVPLISRRSALAAALLIIDTEGLEALSIRRLAEELGVNGASLYHHFRNKEEILNGAARLALSDVRTPDSRDEPWPVWVARNAHRLRTALLQHPGLIPVVIKRGPLGTGTSMMESSAALLESQGLRLGSILPLLESLELFAVASAMHESRGNGSEQIPELDFHEHPTLVRAASARNLSADQIFDAVVTNVIETVCQLNDAEAPAASDSKRRPAKTAHRVLDPA
jgi:TetR/AcrR family tetracycline transcriptional repressor